MQGKIGKIYKTNRTDRTYDPEKPIKKKRVKEEGKNGVMEYWSVGVMEKEEKNSWITRTSRVMTRK